MDPLLGLLLLWAVTKWKGGPSPAPGKGGSLWPKPRAGKPVDKGGGGASSFPVTPPPPTVPIAPVHTVKQGAKWKPYAPLNAPVIARAQALLRDKSFHINEERIEPDPAGQGSVRYLKVNAPPGKISVTAWRPSLAQLPATSHSTRASSLRAV